MSRMVSFWLLVAIIVVLVIVLFKVMATFILPLFLAAVLVVIFNPFHRRVLAKLKNRRRIAAAATTGIILLIVLLPIGLLVGMAMLEGRQLFKQVDGASILRKVEETRERFGLSMPHQSEIRTLENQFLSLQTCLLYTSPSPRDRTRSRMPSSA